MNRMPALFALGLTLTAPPAIAQEEPPVDREAVSPQVETTPQTSTPADATSPAPAAPVEPGTEPAARTQRFKTMDRLELDSTAITGNRELPKVLYIVPWKKADLGDFIGRPANSLLDEVLTPVDREVFRRQTDYFAKLNAEALEPTAPGQAPPAQAPVAEPAR